LDNIYELALEIVLEMDKLSETREYQIMAFDFMERSKEANLLLNISNRNAKRYGKVPNDLLNLERTLKIDITNFQEQLNSLQATQSTDSARLSSLSNSLLDDKLRLDSVINVMEKQFPHYYDLKYNTKTLSLTDIQNKLQKNQVLLEYFDGDSTIYVCAINRNDYLIHQFQKDSAYRQSLKLFGDYFSNYGNQDKPDEKEVFGSAYQLYHYLIEQVNEVIPTSVDHLIVVPDAQLSMFPWSLFLKHPFKEQSTGFRDQHYLIKDHAMSYAYSSSTLFADKTSSNSSNAGLLAFAPSYSDQTINSYLPSIKNEMRGALSGLPYNNQELESIEAYFEGDYYFSDQASERNFKEKAGNSEVLHLAMHALVDHEDPMLSKLIFQNSTDSLEDGMLHTYELFNMEIPAKMVVLSACETGAGKIRDGEGVMSLGRAFSYAGCPSVVMSQWSINDRSTAELMASFYRYLSEGENKAQALRKAQLDFLDKAPEIRINPYFWGGFAVFGDPEPIGSNRHYWFWVLGIGLVLITILIFVRKRRKAAS
ncbi:MAG: CHAT domain-containing protein, partial [Bacteroidota bacterium]